MFCQVEVWQHLVDVQTNQGLQIQVVVAAEYNVPLAASGQKLIRVWWPVLVD
jgi:hypothetical protein